MLEPLVSMLAHFVDNVGICVGAADMWRDVLSPKGWNCGGHHVGAKKK